MKIKETNVLSELSTVNETSRNRMEGFNTLEVRRPLARGTLNYYLIDSINMQCEIAYKFMCATNIKHWFPVNLSALWILRCHLLKQLRFNSVGSCIYHPFYPWGDRDRVLVHFHADRPGSVITWINALPLLLPLDQESYLVPSRKPCSYHIFSNQLSWQDSSFSLLSLNY